MKRKVIIILLFILIILSVAFVIFWLLNKYAIENLIDADIKPAVIDTLNDISKDDGYSSTYAKISFIPDITGKNYKTTSAVLNLPKGASLNDYDYPIVILIRGYVDQKSYITGTGTKRVGEYFANNGFITIAPDFLGYGNSDPEADNIFEARFQTYTTILSLLKALDNHKNIFIWGHSNGGQIAITILEIVKKQYPTILWAPVSKSFPYSILFYTDNSEDGGKLIRSELAKFENSYDTDKYSIINYLDRIKSDLQIHQGTSDDAVPTSWNNDFTAMLKELDKKYNYFIYTGADHNLTPGWNLAVQRSLEFYKSYIK